MRLWGFPRSAADEEDVALSALNSFFQGITKGRFPKLFDRHDLWTVLTVLTTRKACDLIEHETRAKRDWRQIKQDAAVDEAAVIRLISREPDPSLAAEITDRIRHLLNLLDDNQLRTIAVCKLEGYTNEEIAAQIDCALATVERRVALIRECWLHERSD